MKRILAVASCATGEAQTLMAAQALKETAQQMGHAIEIETPNVAQNGESASAKVFSTAEISEADVVIFAADSAPYTARFAGKPIYATRPSDAIRHTHRVLDAAIGLIPAQNSVAPMVSAPDETLSTASSSTRNAEVANAPVAEAPLNVSKKLVGITSCPTGIAHTFMAAEALQKSAKKLGHIIKVETQGSVGSQNTLSDAEIADADAVVIAADTKVDLSRFAGKAIYMTGTKDAMHHGTEVIEKALAQPVESASSTGNDLASKVESAKASRAAQRTGPYKHLMTGVSYMLPLLVAGGLCIALAFAVGGIYAGKQEGTLGAALNQIGGGTAFSLFVAVLSAFIAYSIADRPGLAPGLIGGMLAQNLGAGFLGGIVSGFLAGYVTLWLAKNIRLPMNLEGLKPVLILPFLSTLIVGLSMIYIIAPPVSAILSAMTNFLNSMRGTNALLLGLLLGAMMAFDMGGPINKAAYTFAVGLLASNVLTPIAAVIAAGMTPPLGLALAATLFPNRFDDEEREARGPAFVLGLAFITEGAIPFAAKDPLRTIPSLMIGSAVAGAISMKFGVQSQVPHGGIFAALIPGAVNGLPMFAVAVLAGTLATTAALWLLKSPIVVESGTRSAENIAGNTVSAKS